MTGLKFAVGITVIQDLCYFNIFLSSDGKMTMDAIGDSTSWT